MTAASEVREHLLAALHADLVGPFDPDASEPEVLQLAPSRWYLTGFLVPEGQREIEDPTAEDDAGAGSDQPREDGGLEENVQKQPKFFPASAGLSVLLPPGSGDVITVRLRWAEYVEDRILPEAEHDGERTKPVRIWRRVPHGPETVFLALDTEAVARGAAVPNTAGIWIGGKLGEAEGLGLEPHTRALSVFVVNRRPTPEPKSTDENTLFQVEMELEFASGFVPRPNLTGFDQGGDDGRTYDADDRVADLQYRNHFDYAVGHGVSWCIPPDGRPGNGPSPVPLVRTTWIPRTEVRRVVTYEQENERDKVTTEMAELATLGGEADVRRKLGGLVEKYGAWIAKQRTVEVGSKGRAEVRDALMNRAEDAKRRIAAGIDLLARNEEVRQAFCWANEAMVKSRRQTAKDDNPRWRLFQLAFVLLNLESIADPASEHREDVELIFFPTGGGKTEAYLGVIAFTLLLRRLRGQMRPDRGLGVTVLLRYTLRLLTLDQLGRAATLICALEQIRRAREHLLGTTRFAIGLWVGKSATANTLAEVANKVRDFKALRGPNPFPLTQCPWCREEITRDSLTMWPGPTKPEEVRVACMSTECEFNGRNTNGDGLPVLFVDEQIYQELPAFLVATVDKFAMLPWRGETGKLFGRVTAMEGRRFVGPGASQPGAKSGAKSGSKSGAKSGDKPKAGQTALPEGLWPPELIVQDELHLISGPLGTMVGLYETAIEWLCTRHEGERQIKPKILASTATVRRANRQIRALFGRSPMNLFPPPGIDLFETFFAKVDHESPGRLYVGVAGAGRSMKRILLRTYVTLLGAALKAHAKDGPSASAYTTVAGYFNSLRELGGMRRLVEDDVRTGCLLAEQRRPLSAASSLRLPGAGAHRWVAKRELKEPVELTSRESTDKIAASKARLEQHLPSKDHIDVLLASNMISVGVDIDRLGLMVVAGQPKTTSEYIQATSRVGRKEQWPGLVVTCFNVHKPRDRSHYERFSTYHESFYRFVEATSLTPFSGRALDRGLAALLVTLIRLGLAEMTPSKAVMNLKDVRGAADAVVDQIAKRAAAQPGLVDGAAHGDWVRARARNILDKWTKLVGAEGAQRIYSTLDRPKEAGRAILRTPIDAMGDELDADEYTFVAPTSMRDVEGTVHLWVERYALGGKKR